MRTVGSANGPPKREIVRNLRLPLPVVCLRRVRGQPASTVLRGREGSNTLLLPDPWKQPTAACSVIRANSCEESKDR